MHQPNNRPVSSNLHNWGNQLGLDAQSKKTAAAVNEMVNS
jgi:hypothetical protein